MSGRLRDGFAPALDPSPTPLWADLINPEPYVHWIEAGERTDPRRGRTIFRKAGPARMVARGAAAALPAVRAFLGSAARELLAEVWS